MNGDSPMTRHDLEQLHPDVKPDRGLQRGELKEAFEQMRSELTLMHDDLVERLSHRETRLLQAFYSYAETNNRRLVQGEAVTALVISRITTLEDRVLALEKRLNIQPS
jgi:hypothetical protein